MNRNEWFAANVLLSLGLLTLALVFGIAVPGGGGFVVLPLLAAGLLELAGHPLPPVNTVEQSGS